MKMIYGLGNPGARYHMTRHNIGFMVVDLLSREYSIEVKKKASNVLYGKGGIGGINVMLAKPQTFMNLSGLPLSSMVIKQGDLIVIHDDMDIPFGQVRVKENGGTGGHKGLESIRSVLHTGDFVRIRCGIGRPPEGMDGADYVLSRFTGEEIKTLSDEISKAAEAVIECMKSGAASAMNIYNRREPTD
ncbi:MAG TPA: aminoacyl-tRNA hydrolase [Desulfomonilia bacterium]